MKINYTFIKKLAIFVVSIYLLNINLVYSEIIKKIKISGNDRLANETIILFSELNINDDITWPNYDEKILSETTIPYVIQINGKKRALIQVHRDTSEQNLIKLITNETNLKKYLENKEIKRKIFVPGKLINIIV